MDATTVKDWTDGQSVLKNGSAGPKVRDLRTLLSQAGIDMTKYPEPEDPDLFDYGLEEAVCEYQKMSMDMEDDSPKLGIVDDLTLNSLLNSASMMDDLLYAEGVSGIEPDSADPEDNPHFGSFFTQSNTKTERKNGTTINIVLGDEAVVKTIHNVYMRSVGVEFDTSGNPISETYEFIGQDLTESDETMDSFKYK